MQAVSKKYCSGIVHGESSPSERFNVRVEIAREVSYNVTALNHELCDDLLKKTMGSVYNRDKNLYLQKGKAMIRKKHGK